MYYFVSYYKDWIHMPFVWYHMFLKEKENREEKVEKRKEISE